MLLGETLSGEIFVGRNYSSGEIFVTSQKIRHFRPTKFRSIRYAMNWGTQSSDRGIVSDLDDPLWYLPDGVVNLEEKCFSAYV